MATAGLAPILDEWTSVRSLRSFLASLVWITVVAATIVGCAPSVYKEEVLSFKKSSEQAVETFEGLRTDRTTFRLLEESIPKQPVELTGPCGDIVEKDLQKQGACLGAWARYRATPAADRAATPSCNEPTGYLTLPYATERDACRLGVKTATGVEPARLPSETLLIDTAAVGKALKEYAGALGDLATSTDGDALTSSVGKAKTALESLVDQVNKTAKANLKKEAIGPISELVGTALLQVLEYRRYRTMRRIVDQADPVVTEAAGVLSRASMVLLIPRLRDSANAVGDAVRAVNDADQQTFGKRLENARLTVKEYLSFYTADPASGFKALGEAHQALKVALTEPHRGFEGLQRAIKDFADKAEAAYKVFSDKKEKADGK